MNFLNHSLNGYRIPLYIEEILTHNYCPCFMRMSMVREGESYKFSYRPGSLTRINPKGMDTYEKLLLVRSLITVKETAESYLISAEDYLFEPELVYTTDMSLSAQDLKILFYPDVRKLDFSGKLMHFTERIGESGIREERELIRQLIETAESGDMNRIKMFLDKHILRIESRTVSKAG